MVGKACSRKADQLAKPSNTTVHGWYVSLLAGAIKWNRPKVTFRSVFQNPVTNVKHCVSVIVMSKIYGN